MKGRQIEEEERERVLKALSKRLEAHDESRKAAQDKLHEICEGLRAQIEGLEGKVGGELEEKFTAEDNRLQSAYEDLQMDGGGDISKMIQKAKAELLVMQSYDVLEKRRRENEEAFDLSSLCEVKTERHPVLEMVELMKPTNVRFSETNKGAITLQFTCLDPDEMKTLSGNGDENQVRYKCLLTKRGEDEGKEFFLDPGATYEFRVKAVIPGTKEGEWGEETRVQVLDGQIPEKLEEELENIKRMLSERIEIHDESRKAAQEKFHEICEELRAQVEKLGEKINSELEEKFTTEDNRLQENLSELRSSRGERISKMIQKAKAELLVEQTYDVIERNPDDDEDEQKSRISSLYEFKKERKASFEVLGERKPTNLIPLFTENGGLSLSFTFFNEDEVDALNDLGSQFEVEVKVWEKGYEEETSRTHRKEFTLGSDEPVCFRNTFSGSTTYCLKMRIVHQGMSTQWSDEAGFIIPEFKKCCVWKECPYDADEKRIYSVDKRNPRIATKLYGDGAYCTVIGNTALPLRKVTSWDIRIIKSFFNNGNGIYVGVAPFDIDQNEKDNSYKCGWYFGCYHSKLCSGPPHNYRYKVYGPRKKKGDGQYVHNGDSVGVVMDTIKGELSFAVNGVNLGVAYEGIPLDKPLVPCVILGRGGDSVELII